MFEQLITPLIGLALTLLVFSYLLGDNLVFRFTANLLAGLSLGYAVLVVVANVLGPRVGAPMIEAFATGNLGLALSAGLPLLFGTLILTKLSRGRMAMLGNWGMGVLIGVGAGVAVGGALLGSLVALINASSDLRGDGSALGGLYALLALVATAATLLVFWYSGRANNTGDTRAPALAAAAIAGRVFLMITFGALFGGALAASVSTLVDRLALVTQIAAVLLR